MMLCICFNTQTCRQLNDCLMHSHLLPMQDMMKMPVPRMSASAVLQEHVNPEHAAHFAAVDSNKDGRMMSDTDLPAVNDK